MQLAVLGPVRAQRDGSTIELGTPKQRALVAALALHVGRPVSPDALVDLLWGDDAPTKAPATLQTYVAGLRRAFEPDRRRWTASSILPINAVGYVLDLGDDAIDAVRFANTVERVHRVLAQPAGAVPAPPAGYDAARLAGLRDDLDAALAGWGGLPFADLRDAGAVVAARVRLEELYLVAVEDRALLRLAAGEAAAVAAELAAWAREHPLRESLGAVRALALAQAGRQAEALGAVREIRQCLALELGVDLGPGLRAVQAAILRGGPPFETSTVAGPTGAPPARRRRPGRPVGLAGRHRRGPGRRLG